MNHRLVFLVACVGCAAADAPTEDSGIEAPLAGGVTLKERSVPDSIADAMDELTGSAPSVRRFDITAPSSTTSDERIRGAVEGLFHRTRLGGHYSLAEYCAKLPAPEAEPVGCATAILAGATRPGDFDTYLEDWTGDFPEAVADVRAYLAARVGTASNELRLDVPVGHFEDGEFWHDYTAHRAILFDPTASRVVIVRYFTASSL
jgi:hypothetical protein